MELKISHPNTVTRLQYNFINHNVNEKLKKKAKNFRSIPLQFINELISAAIMHLLKFPFDFCPLIQ